MTQHPITEIAGIKRYGERVEQIAVPGRNDMAVFVTNVELQGGKREPCLIVGRRVFDVGRSVVIPLCSAWQYDMPDLVAEKVALVSKVLFDQPTLSEAHLVMDTVLTNLPRLYSWAPERMQSAADIKNEAARYGLKVQDSNGNTIMDFT